MEWRCYVIRQEKQAFGTWKIVGMPLGQTKQRMKLYVLLCSSTKEKLQNDIHRIEIVI